MKKMIKPRVLPYVSGDERGELMGYGVAVGDNRIGPLYPTNEAAERAAKKLYQNMKRKYKQPKIGRGMITPKRPRIRH